jgi:hypothetical protein
MNIFNVCMFMQYGVMRLLSSSSIINADSEVQIHNVIPTDKLFRQHTVLYDPGGLGHYSETSPTFSPAIQGFIKETAWRELTGRESYTNLLISR